MKHRLHLLLATGLSAVSIGAAAAVHDWTATRIGAFDDEGLGVVGMNNAGQVAGVAASRAAIPLPPLDIEGRSFLYSPGSPGQLVDLGTLGGIRTEAMALNSSGQVVGWGLTADAKSQGFIYRNGGMQGVGLPGEIGGAATGINNRGQYVLNSTGADNLTRGAIVNPDGSSTVLSVPGVNVFPGGINNRGQVFGLTINPATTAGGFLYDNGRLTDIGSLRAGGPTQALDMNESGQIVGNSDKTDGSPHPFLYSDGRMTEMAGATGPGTAVDINDGGQVVGNVDDRGFVYSDGQVKLFGDRFTYPRHINELGMVVGHVFSATGGPPSHGFFYSSDDGRTTNLSEWIMNAFDDVARVDGQSIGLNDLGQIAIGATLTNGQQTLFVLTPIPEPSTYALMLSGLGVLAWIAWRQRGRSMGNRVDQTHHTGLAA